MAATLRPGERGEPLELVVSTNNDALIVSVIAVDPEGGLFGGEVSPKLQIDQSIGTSISAKVSTRARRRLRRSHNVWDEYKQRASRCLGRQEVVLDRVRDPHTEYGFLPHGFVPVISMSADYRGMVGNKCKTQLKAQKYLSHDPGLT